MHGDININLFKLNRTFYNFLIINNLHTTITTPTRHDPQHNTASLIDVTLTTLVDTEVTAGTISPPITDHQPTYTILHKPIPRKFSTQKSLSTAQYEKKKYTIQNEIETKIAEASNNTNTHTTTSQHFHNIQTAIQETIEKHERIPKKRRNHWCTPQYKRRIRKQHTLHQQWIQNPTLENKKRHTQYRKKLAKDIKTAKKHSLTERLAEARRDTKQQIKILNTIIPKKYTNRTSPTTLEYENNTYTNPQSIADALVDHYTTVGHKTTETIPKGADTYIENTEQKQNSDLPTFTLRHTTNEIVTKTMNKINRNKANDIYKIKPTILKDLTPFLSPILTDLFNRTIDENEYPDSLKITKGIELYKKGDKTLPENYRPISLLPIIAKLLDTIINQQLMKHLTDNNIISPTQYAFRPNSSCTLALQTIIDKITSHANKRNPTLAVYVDLSKAYDTISHEKLIDKLKNEFNFTPETVTYFTSYFHNRKQSIHTQHAKSKTRTITHGIPQGSTLSTTFFLLYINNIIRTVPNSKVYTYADDTTLIITATTEQELQTLAQTELGKLINYFHKHNLVPNPKKTQYTTFYPKPPTNNVTLQINGKQITETNQAPLLGITVQHNLKYQETITNIIKKLQPTIQKFKYANKFLPTYVMKQQYYSLAYPHLIGAISIWGTDNPNSTRLQPLIKTQKKIIRLLKNLPPRTHAKPIMIELEILGITDLYKLRVCTEMHGYIYPREAKNRPENHHNYISTAQIHEYPTRHSEQLHYYIPNRREKPKLAMQHFTKKYTEIWNKIPREIREIQSLETFKKSLKEHLLENQKNTEELLIQQGHHLG